MLLLLLSWSRHLVHLASSLGKSVFLCCFDGSLDIFCLLTTPEVFHWFFILTFFSYSAVLADIMLKEKLHIFGILGCALCVVGSTTIVLHAPQERAIESVAEVWDLATEPGALLSYLNCCHQPPVTPLLSVISVGTNLSFCVAAFLFYAAIVLTATFVLIYSFIPQYGQTHIMVYIGVCSLVGSLSVCASLGIQSFNM
jgi:hypothetical protein